MKELYPVTSVSPRHRARYMSIFFIECPSFHLNIECCPECHSSIMRTDGTKIYPDLIYVRPIKGNGDYNPDWELHIESLVCCRIYHHVKSLPKAWWEDQARKAGVFTGYKFSNSRELDTDREIKNGKKELARIRGNKEEGEIETLRRGGLSGFLSRRR